MPFSIIRQIRLFSKANRKQWRPPRLATHKWHLLTIEFDDNDLVGFVSDGQAIAHVNWPGLTVSDGRLLKEALPAPAEHSPFADSTTSALSEVEFQLVDKGGAVTDLIANRLVNLKGTRSKRIRLYSWPVGVDRLYSDLVSTYQITNRSFKRGTVKIKARDVKRKLKNKIMEPRSWRLLQPISATSESMLISVDPGSEPLPFYTHHETYPADPGVTILYVRVGNQDGEIIGATEQTQVSSSVVRLSGLVRGALNTEPDSAEFADDTEIENRTELTEFIYIAEPLPDLLNGIIVGQTMSGNQWAKHWTVSEDRRWLDTTSLVHAAPDLATLPLRIGDYGQVSAKDLIEKECLPFLNLAFGVNPEGQLELRRRGTLDEQAPADFEFNESNTATVGELTVDTDEIKSGVAIQLWEPVTRTWRSPILLTDAQAVQTHGDTELKIIRSKLMHTSLQTIAQIRKLLPQLAEFYLGERVKFPVVGKPITAAIRPGARIRAKFKDVRDSSQLSGGQKDVDRAFMIQSRKRDKASGGYSYNLLATTGQREGYQELLTAAALPDSVYEDGATDLMAELGAGAFYLTGGIWHLRADQYDISFNKKYSFMHGPLYQDENADIEGSDNGPMFQLWIPHAFHSDSARTVVTTGHGTGQGGAPGEIGDPGFMAPVHAQGDMLATGSYDSDGGDYTLQRMRYQSNPGVRYNDYGPGDFPSLALSLNDDVLRGLPADLSGYAGCGSGSTRVTYYNAAGNRVTHEFPGKTGERSSAGILYVHRGMTQGVNQRWILDGQDAAQPGVVEVAPGHAVTGSLARVVTAASGQSGPGSLLTVADGNYTHPILNDTHVLARPGVGAELNPAPSDDVSTTNLLGEHYSSRYVGSPRVNHARSCSRAMYIPIPAKVQERTDLSDLAAELPDGSIFVHEQDSRPSSGNRHDLWITTAELNSGSVSPATWVYLNNGYEQVAWDTTKYASEYRAALAMKRDGGSEFFILPHPGPASFKDRDRWLNPDTGVEVALFNAPGKNQIIRYDGAYVGEELIKDTRFSRSAMGERWWEPTRDPDLRAVNVLQQIANEVASVFITHGVLEGEFGSPDSGAGGSGSVLLPPPTVNLVVISSTEIDVRWSNPADMSIVVDFAIYNGATLVTTTNTQPYRLGGLSADTEYTIAAASRDADGNVSALTTDTARTLVSGTSQAGIQLTGTGRLVTGTAYQDNGGGPIEAGRVGSIRFADAQQLPITMGANAAFSIDVPSAYDNNLGQLATLYFNNGDDTTRALLEFTFEL